MIASVLFLLAGFSQEPSYYLNREEPKSHRFIENCTVRSLEDLFYREAYKRGYNPPHPQIDFQIVEQFSGAGCQGRNTIGCAYMGQNKIEFYKTWWENHDCSWRELLLVHEMGHLILRLRHKRGFHIMSPYILNAGDYMRNRNELLNEMFEDSR